MRLLVSLAALGMLGACGAQDAQPANKQENSPPPNTATPLKATLPANASAEPAASGNPGLDEMSLSQRRAYDRGFADCRAGRYDPDRYPEAYRIGCAAAHDAASAGR